MRVERVIYPVETLGPGKRLVIWMAGCSKRCPGCANPEMWESPSDREISVELLMESLRQALPGGHVEGITLTGGDPLEQRGELLRLLPFLGRLSDDILVYTGYTYAEIERLYTADELSQLRADIGVLIDGPYIERQNDGVCPLRGSTNQSVIFFNERLMERYRPALQGGRRIQNVFCNGKIISVGIHNRETQHDLR